MSWGKNHYCITFQTIEIPFSEFYKIIDWIFFYLSVLSACPIFLISKRHTYFQDYHLKFGKNSGHYYYFCNLLLLLSSRNLPIFFNVRKQKFSLLGFWWFLKVKHIKIKIKICFVLTLKNDIEFLDKKFANQFFINNSCLKVCKEHIMDWILRNYIFDFFKVCKASLFML